MSNPVWGRTHEVVDLVHKDPVHEQAVDPEGGAGGVHNEEGEVHRGEVRHTEGEIVLRGRGHFGCDCRNA